MEPPKTDQEDEDLKALVRLRNLILYLLYVEGK